MTRSTFIVSFKIYLNILSHSRKFDFDIHANLGQYIFPTDPRKLEDLRRLDSTAAMPKSVYISYQRLSFYTLR